MTEGWASGLVGRSSSPRSRRRGRWRDGAAGSSAGSRGGTGGPTYLRRAASKAAPSAAASSSAEPRAADANLTPSSSFIARRLGAARGKVVRRTVAARVAEAAGIERAAASRQRRAARRERVGAFASTLVASAEALALLRDPAATRLTRGDATKLGAFPFSHVYMYDKVFSDPTTEMRRARSSTTREAEGPVADLVRR